jgi:hypothetical protein
VDSFPLAIPPITNKRSSSPYSCYMLLPSHPPRLDYSNYTWRRVQIMKLLVMQFSPPSRHLIPLGPNILLSILFSNTLSLCSSLNVRDRVSHSYRTTGKIIVLYVLILKFFDSRREDRGFNGKYVYNCLLLILLYRLGSRN